MIRTDKPKKSSVELISELKSKGVSFNLISESDAVSYLEKNNYLRTAAYRRNFEKYQKGENTGKYIDLDFAYLSELSSIDKQLREILLSMCIDVEHAIKSKFLATIENNPEEDGYNIVDLFLSINPKLLEVIEKKSNAVFTENLINKYFNFCYVFSNEIDADGCNRCVEKITAAQCPVWVFVELISFGDLLNLIYLYNQQYPLYQCVISNHNDLAPVKSLRNACAHNNCILNDMRPTTTTRPTGSIAGFIINLKVSPSLEIHKKLSCRPTFEIVALLKSYNDYVSSNVKARGLHILSDFVSNRMYQHIDYFSKCNLIKTSFDFFKKTLDKLV